MKKLYFLLMLLSISALSVKAQQQTYTKSQLTYGVHPGTVTTLDGQILNGFVINVDDKQNQDQCIFYTDYKDSRSKQVYKPADIAGYSIENDQYKSISYNGNMSLGFGKPAKHFVYVAQPGAITTFVFYVQRDQQLVWQKGKDEPVSNASMLLSFKKSMLKLVGDDADLAAKIDRKDKGYGMLNIVQIVNEYNTWAAAKQ
jgi:hypothetical protein